MITWSGRILAFLGTGHLTLALLFSSRHIGGWLSLQLWSDHSDVGQPPPPVGAFWLAPGSFGLPLVLVGLLVIWMDRRGIVPPTSLAWALLAWSLVCALIAEPAPWVLAVIAAVLLLLGVRRAGVATPSHNRQAPATNPWQPPDTAHTNVSGTEHP